MATEIVLDSCCHMGRVVYDTKRRRGVFVTPHMDGATGGVSVTPLTEHTHSSQLRGASGHVVTDAQCRHILRPVVVDASSRFWTVKRSRGDEHAFATIIHFPLDELGVAQGQVDAALTSMTAAMTTKGICVNDEHAGGCYVCAGYGAMAKNPPPRSVMGDATKRNVPYLRTTGSSPECLDAMAKVATLMGSVSDQLDCVWPALLASLAKDVLKHPLLGGHFMYPTYSDQRMGNDVAPNGTGCIPSNQVAVRLSEPSSLRTHAVVLHVDRSDAPTKYGFPLIYLCRGMEGREGMGDLLIFEYSWGGRAVRVRTCNPGYATIVVFRADVNLHGNVYPDPFTRLPTEATRDANLEFRDLLMRIVPFQLKQVAELYNDTVASRYVAALLEWGCITDDTPHSTVGEYGIDERTRWCHVGDFWTRMQTKPSEVTVRLTVDRSPIHGLGLFTTAFVEEGTHLGQLSGLSVFFSESKDVAEDWALARAHTRLVLLKRSSAWVVVNIAGSVFEFANSSNDEDGANMQVGLSGRCEACRDIQVGEEIVWWYGTLFGLR